MKEAIHTIKPGVDIVKSRFFNYRIVYRHKNEDGTINWFNLLTGGSWGNVIGVIVIVCVMVGLVFAYKHDVNALVECCNRCNEAKDVFIPLVNNLSINQLHP